MKDSLLKWGFCFFFVLLFGGCEVNREVVVDPYNKLPTLKRVVIEGPGGDMVGVEVEIVRRLDPLLPEPWNTIVAIILGALVYAILVRSFWTGARETREE